MPLSGDFVIISHLFEFVKRFSKIFFEIFSIYSQFRRDLWGFANRFRDSLFIISLCFLFVKYFLNFFKFSLIIETR